MSTNISWTDETWNSIVGCSRISAGCANCYAATASASPRLQQFPQYQKVADWDGTVEFVESQLLKPLSWKKPKRIFVCSMSDLFHENVPDEWRDRIFAIMAFTPRHTYQVLTKRPENALRYFAGLKARWGAIAQAALHTEDLHILSIPAEYLPLPNVHFGVTVENQSMADKRIPLLLQIPAVWRWLSVEPLLGQIELGLLGTVPKSINPGYTAVCDYISWVVVGGESGNGARPCQIEWIKEIAGQCRSANVPVFIKQLGNFPVTSSPEDFAKSELITRKHYSHWCFDEATKMGFEIEGMHQVKLRDRKGGDISEFPEDLQIRQFPDV